MLSDDAGTGAAGSGREPHQLVRRVVLLSGAALLCAERRTGLLGGIHVSTGGVLHDTWLRWDGKGQVSKLGLLGRLGE